MAEAAKTETRKVGTTPEVVDGVGNGVVAGAVKLTTFMTKFMDGHGQQQIRIGVVIPGGEVRFFKDEAFRPPVQDWLKAGILKQLGLAE